MLSSYRNQSIDIRLKPLTGFCVEDISMKKVNVTHKQEKYLIWSKHWLISNFFLRDHYSVYAARSILVL